MIHNNGTRDTFLTNFTCKIKDKKQHKNSYLTQFNCESQKLKGDYYSLRYNYSELISDIYQMKMKYHFTIKSINYNLCETKGIFK